MICTVLGLLALGRCLEIVATYGILLTCMSYFSSFFLVGSRVCDNLCCFPSDVCYFEQGNITCLRVAGSPRW